MQMVRLLLSLLLLPALVAHAGDTGRVPQTARELWAGLDPAAEPLDVQVVKEWEDGDAGLRYLLYTVGTLKGRKPRMAAYYAFPRGGRSLPAILHLHGGGQRASSDTVRYWTKLGYAAMSINWGGKPVEGDDAPNTDWAGLAAGFREPRHHNDVSPGQDTLHDVPHPANSSWHLCALAARRALTFLQQQPEVDGGRLGLTGHSMGGRLTVLTAIDPRVKAAVPSVGGSGFLYDDLWGIPGSSRHMREHISASTTERWTAGATGHSSAAPSCSSARPTTSTRPPSWSSRASAGSSTTDGGSSSPPTSTTASRPPPTQRAPCGSRRT